jgi:Flagellar hook-length control protein FliK
VSNSVRNIASNRSVDIARFGSGHQSDSPGTDGEFSTVMNSMIDGVDSVAERNGEGANSQGDVGGQGSSAYGTPSSRSVGQVVTGAARSLSGAFADPALAATRPQGRDIHAVLPGGIDGRGQTARAGGGSNEAASAVSLARSDTTATALGPSRSRYEPKGNTAIPKSPDGASTVEPALSAPATIVEPSGSEAEQVQGTPGGSSRHRNFPGAQSVSTISPTTSGANVESTPPDIAANGQEVASNNPFVTAPMSQPVGAAVALPLGAGSNALSPRPVGPTLAEPSQRQPGFDRNASRENADAAAPTASQSNTPTAATGPTSTPDEAAISSIAPRLKPVSSQDQSGTAGASVSISEPPAPTDPPATTSMVVAPLSGSPSTPASPTSGDYGSVSSITVQTAPVQPFVAAGPMAPQRDVDFHSGDRSGPTAVDGMAGSIPTNSSASPTGTTAVLGGPANGVSDSFADALANHVMSMVSTGGHEVTFQLQPPQLGEMTIRIAVQGRDVSTWFGAAQPQAQVAVGQALDQLRSDLAGAGLNLAGAWVGADTSNMRQMSFAPANPTPRRGSFVAAVENSSVSGNETDNHLSGVSVYA